MSFFRCFVKVRYWIKTLQKRQSPELRMYHSKATHKESETRKYYIRDEIVPFEEDATHEFKAHKNLCEEELPHYTYIPNSDRRTRRSASRSLNGFLNSGLGGTVFLGILDSGCAKGLNFTIYQQDHLYASLRDMMSRYIPTVEPHRYSLRFVPVVDQGSTPQEIQSVLDFDPSTVYDPAHRKRDHTLRSTRYCWCQKESMAKYSCGHVAQDYIAEIEIHPWDPDHPDNKHAVGEMKAHPFHEDECNTVYIRQQASSLSYTTPQDLYNISKQEVLCHYQTKLSRLQEERENLQAEAMKK